MRIRYKLVLSYLTVAMLIAAVGLAAAYTSQGALRQSVGRSLGALAQELLDEIDAHLHNRAEEFQLYTTHPMLQDAVARSNREFEAIDDVEAHMRKVDREWTTASAEAPIPLMERVAGGELGADFRRRIAFYRKKYGYDVIAELFVTNRYGANLAASARTTDYRQDDEPWWERARAAGYDVGEVRYDRSAGVYSTAICVRVDDAAGRFAGVMKAVLNVENVIDVIRDMKGGRTPDAEQGVVYKLVSREGRLIYATRPFQPFENVANALPEADAVAPGTPWIGRRDNGDGRGVLVAVARSRGYRDFRGLGWRLVAEHPVREAFGPIAKLKGRMLLMAAVAAALAVLAGLLLSESISRALARLRRGTEIVAAGDLGHQIGSRRTDEIGRVSHAFDRMAERLRTTTVSRDRLAREVTVRERAELALAHKAKELARSNAELEQFAYVASHDLQEPLRMVASYVQLLDRRYSDRLDSDAREFIAFAVEGAVRMRQLIDDLLTYSRVSTQTQAFERIDLDDVFQQATSNLQRMLEENHAVVTADPLPTVDGDRPQLIQLLQNLVGNAVKFRGEQQPRVHVSAERQDGRWQVSVRDNGIGIDPKQADRIFVIFQRLHGRDAYPGTGIGLAICKRIVQRHGGRIWVDSAPGRGSTFHFTLPARTREAP